MTSLIEFNLFAPRNQGAALIGSFSEWKEIPMEKGEDGYFRTKVKVYGKSCFVKFNTISCQMSKGIGSSTGEHRATNKTRTYTKMVKKLNLSNRQACPQAKRRRPQGGETALQEGFPP